ncbi:MAG: DUF1501 domain-containing protein [Panacagrimonas sp.]
MTSPVSSPIVLSRRQFMLRLAGGAATLTLWPSWAATPDADRARFVLVILRGGLDGLHVLPPLGDPDYARIRGKNALGSGDVDALKLDGAFGLHPALTGMHGLWKKNQLLVVPAVASPYRERSHFDAQDVLENGQARVNESADGWLNRATAALGPGTGGDQAIAVGSQVPLVLRGAAPVGTWSPSLLPLPNQDFLIRVAGLYHADPAMADALADARRINAVADTDAPVAKGVRPTIALAQAAARFLVEKNGPSVAVLDVSGWDSHSSQFSPKGGLTRNLGQLDAAMTALREGLGTAWSRTAVLVVTEFGRTVAVNGSNGTDHGTASAALVLGGAVRGGRVAGQWPGLKPGDLHENRDLRPTTDVRALAKGLLLDHLRIPEAALEKAVFPDSRSAPPMRGMVAV